MKMDRKFLGRLATYLVGVAIGLVLVGVIQQLRAGSRAPQHAQHPTPPTATTEPGSR